MVEFALGIVTMLCITLLALVVYLVKHKPSEGIKLTEEEKRKQEEQKKHYNNMMNYDASKAYGGGNG